MKKGLFLGFLLLTLCGGLLGDEKPVVRAYLLDAEDIVMPDPDGGGRDPFSDDAVERPKPVVGEVLEGAPFMSRFFGEGDRLIDQTKWALAHAMVDGVEERAIYNGTTGRLVVRALPRRHNFIRRNLNEFLGNHWSIKTTFRVLKVKSVMVGRRSVVREDFPKEVEEIAVLSVMGVPGDLVTSQTRTGLDLILETQVDREGDSWDSNVTLVSKIAGAEFEFQSFIVGVSGVPLVLELGAREKSGTLLLEVTSEIYLPSGERLDEWVLAEDGRALLKKVRVGKLMNSAEWEEELRNTRVTRRFTVPPTIRLFLSPTGEEKEEMSMKVLLMTNGVDFEERDRVIFREESSSLIVEASAWNVLLVEMALGQGGGEGVFGISRSSLTLVGSAKELDHRGVRAGEFEVLKKVVVHQLDGQLAKCRVGEVSLEVESAGDANDESMEVRVDLKVGDDRLVKTGGEFRLNTSVIMHQEKVGDRWQSWLLRCSVVRAENYLKKLK